MKNAEELALPLELERRLRLGVDHLREVRETMEELARIADAIQPLLGVSRTQVQAKTAPQPRPAAGAPMQVGRTAATPPPAKGPRTPPSSAPSGPTAQDEVPEWRKVFPGLSAKVPGGSKGGAHSS